MTQKDKKLLLQDLCARLQYGVKSKSQTSHLESNTIDGYFVDGDGTKMFHLSEPDFWQEVEHFQYYLRPMSSMTNEEKEEERLLWDIVTKTRNDLHYLYTDFLLSHHLDYRGLISKGLVLEAPEDMYKEYEYEKIF